MDKYESYMEDPPEDTQPATPPEDLAVTQPRPPELAPEPVPLPQPPLAAEPQPAPVAQPPRRRKRGWGWLLLLALLVYLLFPIRSNVLLLGIDRTPQGAVGRSDTIMLLGIQPLTGQVNMLSIPRDLWVPIPGHGESRINSAHAWGETAAPGGGPRLAATTVSRNLGVHVGYTLRVRLEGFPAVIDALGGVEIDLSQPTAGYPSGRHQLNGTQALAFVRNRDGDDFFRQAQGQLFVVSLAKKLLNPLSWPRIPGMLLALSQAVDTNIPFWAWPRLGFAMARAVLFDGIHAVVLPRTAVTPWVTAQGAQVLLPNWDVILPVVREMYGIW
ncbi:MAG: LCP family protein [Anaerolineales bacterium]|nr:LCP family protein [Anaerolineales bacterium]